MCFQIFFILSILVEIVLVRHRRKEARFGPSPANNYTSGYGKRGKFMGLFKRRGTAATQEDPNALPMHATPNQVRQSCNTESTAVGHEPAGYPKHSEAGYGGQHEGHTAYPESGTTANSPHVNPHLSPHANPVYANSTPQHNSNFSTGYAR